MKLYFILMNFLFRIERGAYSLYITRVFKIVMMCITYMF